MNFINKQQNLHFDEMQNFKESYKRSVYFGDHKNTALVNVSMYFIFQDNPKVFKMNYLWRIQYPFLKTKRLVEIFGVCFTNFRHYSTTITFFLGM